jgi:hypothetical protein
MAITYKKAWILSILFFKKGIMITPEHFNKLLPLQQATLLWQHGVPVGELHDRLYVYALYQVGDFYVEVKFCKTNFILQQMCAFSSNCSHLDLYIKDIDISPLAYTA